MTGGLPLGRGTACCRGPKYFLDCWYFAFGFVSVKFAPLTVEALVKAFGTLVWWSVAPRVVMVLSPASRRRRRGTAPHKPRGSRGGRGAAPGSSGGCGRRDVRLGTFRQRIAVC